MSLYTVNDTKSKGLFEYGFKIDSAEVPAGYDSETFTTYSNIIFTFDTASTNGFTNDLGIKTYYYKNLLFHK